jgi:hypothetical protein
MESESGQLSRFESALVRFYKIGLLHIYVYIYAIL